MPGMSARLTGHVEPLRRDGHEVRGRWRLVVETRDGGRRRRVRTVGASGKRAALGLLDEWRAELERELLVADDPTVAELCEAWMKVRREGERPWRPKTAKFYSDNVRLHIVPVLGTRRARALRPADLSLFYAGLGEAGLSETSRHHVHATVRAAFNWGLRNELVARNPALLLEHPPQQSERPASVWTEEQVVRALREAAGTAARGAQLVYVPIVLGAWAGLRCGEICALRWAAVDLEAGRLRVEANLSQTAEGALHELGPKSSAGVRSVPLPRQAVAILAEHKRRQDELRLAAGRRWNRAGYVICRRDGRPVKPSNLSSAWSRFRRVHKLPPARLHDLRHSFATAIFAQGGEAMLKVVQELLGHRDPAITARIYLHSTARQLDAVVAEQEARIAAAADSLQIGHSDGTSVASLADWRAKKSCVGL